MLTFTVSYRMENGNAYKMLVGKPEGKRPLGSPSRRWVDIVTYKGLA
jgi:hypothetical protein